MGREKKVSNTKEALFKRLNGVVGILLTKCCLYLEKEFDRLHKNGGKPPKLTPEDKPYITLKYLRQYPTMDSLAAEYGVRKGAICPAIQRVEDTVVKDGPFTLPGKRALKRKPASIEYTVVDVTESPINRPQKDQKAYYSGKKRHTLKTRVITERNTKKIIDVEEAKGGGHDLTVFKDTIGKAISNAIPLDADPGYVGIKQCHSNSFIPVKPGKKHQLTKREKAYNKRLAKRRVVIEHINAKIKTFKIMAYPYRGHRCNRHAMRMSLICGFINYDRKV